MLLDPMQNAKETMFEAAWQAASNIVSLAFCMGTFTAMTFQGKADSSWLASRSM